MSFDLNIRNYKTPELVKMFDLPENYDRAIVEIRETRMKENILNDREINENLKMKTIQFLVEAKNILLSELKPVFENANAVITNMNQLYNTSYDLKPVKIDQENDHMVQKRKDKPYLSSYPSEFFPGIINPLKKKVNRLYLNIDTRFRDNYFNNASTNFNLSCPMHINDVMTMQLTAMELPLTFYNVSKQYNNDFFTIKINDIFSEVIHVPGGNYNQTGIVAMINKLLQDLGGYFKHIVFSIDLDVTNNNGSGCTIVGINSTYTDPEPIILSLDFQANRFGVFDDMTPLPLKFGWLLGFRNGVYTNNQTYVSEGVVDLQPTKYIYLCVDDYNNNVNNGFYSAFNSSILNKNILARISLQANAFNVFVENNFNVVTQPRQYFGPVNINSLHIELIDAYGRVIDLNNMDYSFCLTFQTAYDV
jgi:hypothetical protein